MYINQQTLQTYNAHSDIRSAFKQVSFPQSLTESVLNSLGVFEVFDGQKPDHNTGTQTVDEFPPAFNQATNRWERSWAVRDKTAEELAADAENLKNLIVSRTQERLDNFARTKNYDGILSAATYAGSTNPTFQAEGQRAVNLRDATWATLYTILGEVQAGTRAVPSGFEAIEPELPILSWT